MQISHNSGANADGAFGKNLVDQVCDNRLKLRLRDTRCENMRCDKAGAKHFVSMGVHHDNFDLWNSVHSLKHRLRFGVSEYLSNSYN